MHPADEREHHRRRARLQVVPDDISAHILVMELGQWSIEATY